MFLFMNPSLSRYMVLGVYSVLCSLAVANQALRDGDIVFSGSDQGQGEAIIAATGSPYTHCGIVFQREGKLMVLEAVQPVGVVSLEDFKARGKPGAFLARRLKLPLAPANYQIARTWAEAQIGKNYDGRFLWDDGNLYCSELVWKIYQHAGVELCTPRRFRDYDLEKASVKKLIDKRFGGMARVPLDEKVVAPSDLAVSKLLVDIPS
jgi:hypothetical protein